jgi:hypothetical protein
LAITVEKRAVLCTSSRHFFAYANNLGLKIFGDKTFIVNSLKIIDKSSEDVPHLGAAFVRGFEVPAKFGLEF